MAEKIELILGELILPSRRLRFLHLKKQDEVLLQKEVCGDYPTLFLGTDVLAHCSIAVTNYPRAHAKHCKKGLTTKINFPSSVRISGIQGTAKGVWFYNIQGLFKVAFQLYSREEQLDILKFLQPLWSARFSDPLLQETTNVSLISQNEISLNEQNITSLVTTSIGNTLEDCESNHPISEQNIPVVSSIEKKYEDFCIKLKDFKDNCLRNEMLSECDKLLSCFTDIVNDYQTRSKADNVNQEPENNVLCSVCEWVGKQFRLYKSDIESNVTEFKTRHIATIDKLPPSEAVVEELFPQSMIVLLKAWMDVESSTGTNATKWLPYPSIQLILEIANQTLVSGVSHVLYSRLVNTQSV